jgi:membrane-bound ClpP family serine protease
MNFLSIVFIWLPFISIGLICILLSLYLPHKDIKDLKEIPIGKLTGFGSVLMIFGLFMQIMVSALYPEFQTFWWVFLSIGIIGCIMVMLDTVRIAWYQHKEGLPNHKDRIISY